MTTEKLAQIRTACEAALSRRLMDPPTEAEVTKMNVFFQENPQYVGVGRVKKVAVDSNDQHRLCVTIDWPVTEMVIRYDPAEGQ